MEKFALVNSNCVSQIPHTCASSSNENTKSRIVDAIELYRALEDDSERFLVRASDDQLYLLKLVNSQLRRRLVANEALTSILLEKLELPTPNWAAVHISEEFIDMYPALWFGPGKRRRRPKAGLHFGSQLVMGKDKSPPYEFLPSSWISRVRNSEEFIGITVFDRWCGSRQIRQVQYVRDDSNRSLRAVFVGHGYCLSDSQLSFRNRTSNKSQSENVRTTDQRNYEQILASGTLKRWAQRIGAISLGDLWDALSLIPEEWTAPNEFQRVAPFLMKRYVDLQAEFPSLPMERTPS